MQVYLDIRTLSFVAGIISILLFLCMLYVSHTRKTYKGFQQWTLASFLSFLGMGLISMRGFLPDLITIVAANTFLALASFFIYVGFISFVGRERRIWPNAMPVLLLTGMLLYFTYSLPSVNARIILIAGLTGWFSARCAFLVYRYIPLLVKSPSWLLVIVLGGHASWSAWRIIYSLFVETRIEDFMRSSSMQGTSLISHVGFSITLIIGLIILNLQRVEEELSKAIEEVRTLRGILPICSSCKKVRDDKGSWNQLESYVMHHSHAEFTHGLCPECAQKLYPELVRAASPTDQEEKPGR